MTQPLKRRTTPVRVAENRRDVRSEQRKPNIRGFKVFVGDFVAPDSGANDPPETSPSSPPWLNNFTYEPNYPVWFAHGLDGELDMGGMYDLVTGSPVSGTIAFMMPNEWAYTAPVASMFPIELATGVWSIAVQQIDINDVAATTSRVPVRIFWPIVATAYP